MCLGLLNELFPSGFPTKTLYTRLLSPDLCYVPCPSHPSQFDHPNNIGCGVLVCVTIDRMCMIEMKSMQDIYCSISFLIIQSTSGIIVSVKVLVIFILHHNMEVEIPGNIKQLVIQLTSTICYFKVWEYE